MVYQNRYFKRSKFIFFSNNLNICNNNYFRINKFNQILYDAHCSKTEKYAFTSSADAPALIMEPLAINAAIMFWSTLSPISGTNTLAMFSLTLKKYYFKEIKHIFTSILFNHFYVFYSILFIFKHFSTV